MVEFNVRSKLHFFDEEETEEAQFEAFMKLAGPYWMSCVVPEDDEPILDPDHYLTYLDPPA